jgi:hypothetical protein
MHTTLKVYNICFELTLVWMPPPTDELPVFTVKTARLSRNLLSQFGKNINVKCLTKHCAMKTYGGGGRGYLYRSFLDFGTSCRWAVSFTPLPLCIREKGPGTHWMGEWMSPDPAWTTRRGRNFLPYRNSNSDRPILPTQLKSLVHRNHTSSGIEHISHPLDYKALQLQYKAIRSSSLRFELMHTRIRTSKCLHVLWWYVQTQLIITLLLAE